MVPLTTLPGAHPDAAFHGSLWLVVFVVAAVAVPFVVLVGTSFVKIQVVLSIVRSAFGAARVPGALVVTGLAAVLTLHVMAPTLSAVASASDAGTI